MINNFLHVFISLHTNYISAKKIAFNVLNFEKKHLFYSIYLFNSSLFISSCHIGNFTDAISEQLHLIKDIFCNIARHKIYAGIKTIR